MSEHPRVRGENVFCKPPQAGVLGTSPRARGKQVDSLERYGYPRNIPACAGKTRSVMLSCWNSWEHPRVRGENSLLCELRAGLAGTSPHTRGKPPANTPKPTGSRNIPAHAGKTTPRVEAVGAA